MTCSTAFHPGCPGGGDFVSGYKFSFSISDLVSGWSLWYKFSFSVGDFVSGWSPWLVSFCSSVLRNVYAKYFHLDGHTKILSDICVLMIKMINILIISLRQTSPSRLIYHNAQFAVWVVQWPCGILALAIKTLSHGKAIFLRLFFLCSFRKKTWKLVPLFIFRHFIFGTLKIGNPKGAGAFHLVS